MMRTLCLVLTWSLFSVSAALVIAMTAHLLLRPPLENTQASNLTQPQNIALANTANNQTGQVKGVTTAVEADDARTQLVENFLARHDSPLEPHDFYAKKIIEIADRYNLDFRLLPAIAMQESNLCKKIPEGSFNCLGFGIHAKGTLTFDSYEANFERAAREIKANYIDKGRVTPEQIMAKYTPHSNGSWANSVNQWMAEMRYDDRVKGRESSASANVLEFTTPTPSPIASDSAKTTP